MQTLTPPRIPSRAQEIAKTKCNQPRAPDVIVRSIDKFDAQKDASKHRNRRREGIERQIFLGDLCAFARKKRSGTIAQSRCA
jgi:hypothetical protein